MAKGKKTPPPVHKASTKERLKRIVSSIFVALLSFALVLLFVTSDLLQMSGTDTSAIASIDGKELSRHDPTIKHYVRVLQDRDKKISYQEALRRACGRYIRHAILLLAAKDSGIQTSDGTIDALARSYALQQKTTLAALANSLSRRELLSLEQSLTESFLRASIAADMASTGRATHLELSLNEGLKRRKVALEVAIINLAALQDVSDATLKSYYDRNKNELSEIYHPISITVDTQADAEKLLKSITPADMNTIQARVVVHGVKVNPYDLGWFFPLGQNTAFQKAITSTKAGAFSSPVPVNDRRVIFFIKERKAIKAYTDLGQEGLQALKDLYRSNNSATMHLKAEKRATSITRQLTSMITDKKMPLTAAAATLGLKSVKTGLFSFQETAAPALAALAHDPAFQAAALSLQKGALSGVIKSDDNWYLLRAVAVKMLPNKFKKLQDKKLADKIKKPLVALYRKAIITLSKENTELTYRDWLISLARKYDVRVYDQNNR